MLTSKLLGKEWAKGLVFGGHRGASSSTKIQRRSSQRPRAHKKKIARSFLICGIVAHWILNLKKTPPTSTRTLRSSQKMACYELIGHKINWYTSPDFYIIRISDKKIWHIRLWHDSIIWYERDKINRYESLNLIWLLKRLSVGRHIFFICHIRIKIVNSFIRLMTWLYFLF